MTSAFQCPRSVLHDKVTGREIWRISPDGKTCIASYMYVNSFTEDERFVVYESDLSGQRQIYRCELATGETIALTEGPDVNPHGANVHPGTQELFYRSGTQYWAVHVVTRERRPVFNIGPKGWRAAGNVAMFSRRGTYFSFGYEDAAGLRGIARARCDGSGVESVHVRPAGEGTQHIQFVPTPDENRLTFAPAPDHQQEWQADHERRARAYLVHAAAGTCEPFLVMPPPCTATHEYWGATGERLYYHKKTRPTWVPTWICSLDLRTREHRTIYASDTIKLGHSCVTRDERRIVSDCQEPNRNELLLIEVATGKAEVLCWPNTTVGNGQTGHVHPSFSPSGRYVLYTSDVSGLPQVYVIDLGAR